MLAYLFWHQPRPGVDRDEYEEAQRAFHAALDVPSACFRVEELPFATGGARDGYEDWYLVEGWQGIGELNEAAIDARRRTQHDRAAAMVARGWGAIYASVAGPEVIPEHARWLEKPAGAPLEALLEALPSEAAVWRRQLVLGPAPELCVAAAGPARHRIGS